MKNNFLDNKGQLSLEYILSSMIVILIISLISVPVLLATIDYSNDVIDSINAKNELSKISQSIDFCYASGKGSKRIVLLDLNQDANIRFYNDGNRGFASMNLNLSDGPREIVIDYDCADLNENIHISRGFNKIIIEWNEDSNKIEVKKDM